MDQSSRNQPTACKDGKGQPRASAAREARLKAALKANMARRKSQAKERSGLTVVDPAADDAQAGDAVRDAGAAGCSGADG